MFTSFLDLFRHLLPAQIRYNLERFEYSYVLDKKFFPDCVDKEFKYAKRLWNPFGKTGLAHHGPDGWDWFLPEELKTDPHSGPSIKP